jgi:ATP-dependent DNA helicase RecG
VLKPGTLQSESSIHPSILSFVPLELSTPIQFVRRIGERVAAGLRERGVETVEDLLYHLPFRYEDRLDSRPIATLQAGETVSLLAEVRGTSMLRTRSGPMFEMTVGQGLSTVKCIWFHGAYLRDRFRVGQHVALYGKLEGSRSGNAPNALPGATKLKMIQPGFEILPDASASGEDAEFTMLEIGRIVPVYESLGARTAWGAKLTSRWLRRVVWTLFKELQEGGVQAQETLPHALLERLQLPARLEALQQIHFPAAGTPMTQLMSARTPAHRRLIFEELWYLELGLELKRRRLREREGTAFVADAQVRTALKQVLPFKPTAAQKRVLGEIVADMKSPRPMRRLLQGDVGSGKTIVALEAALVAIENGYQVAMMAPTEILATQHFLAARKLLADAVSPRLRTSYRVTLLTGSLDQRSKREARGRIFRGETHLAIGTHALVEEKVDFANLGLVIVDEQHRFGVQQRFRLMRKPGADGRLTEPDVLVMTATPIPRTLALTMYGDLEASVLDELPPGRTPITTRRMPEERSAEVWEFVRRQVANGRQAYIVYPVIEGPADDQAALDFARDEEAAEATAPAPAAVKSRSKKSASLFAGDGKAAKAMPAKKAPRRKAEAPKLRSATEMFDELRAGALAGLRLGLLHGRMSADDKEVTMARFKRGEMDVLISTTVIEVGVDVPNASLMVIEHAERFGLAQLHQLRGRVGRGTAKSFCVLLTGTRISTQAEARLEAMVRTQNGFELAEIDLAQRGPGEFFGTRQAGMPEFRVSNLVRDRDLLELAKAEAAKFVEGPRDNMPREEIDAVWARLKQQWQRRYGLVEA